MTTAPDPTALNPSAPEPTALEPRRSTSGHLSPARSVVVACAAWATLGLAASIWAALVGIWWVSGGVLLLAMAGDVPTAEYRGDPFLAALGFQRLSTDVMRGMGGEPWRKFTGVPVIYLVSLHLS